MAIYGVQVVDAVHRSLSMSIGALLAVFALGAVLAFLRPQKYGAIIIMILLMHFSVFLIDVVIIAQGDMPFGTLFPEIAYFLIISTALVRWYPVKGKEESEAEAEEEPEKKDVEPEEKEEPEAVEEKE